MRYLLLTRPREDSERLAAPVRAKGYEPLIEPLLTPVYHQSKVSLPLYIQGLLVTSQHALKSLGISQHLSKFKEVPLICVGQKTADLGRALGFASVIQGGENVEDMISWIQKELTPKDGPLFYVHGDVITKDLKTILENYGFSVQAQEVYAMQESTSFSQRTQDLLHQNLVRSVVFFSPRTGRIFAAIARKFQRDDYFSDMTALCLSDSVAENISHMAWNEIKIARVSQEELLLELL